MNSRLLRVLVSACWGAGLALGSEMANAQNLLTDLGPGTAYAINDSGQVVMSIGDGSQFPLPSGIWSNGTVTPFPSGFVGLAINSSGEVAGYLAGIALYGTGTDAAFYSSGAVADIGVNFDPGEGFASAQGINNNGEIVGNSPSYDSDTVDGFIDDNGMVTILSTFPGNSQNEVGMPTSAALGVNDAGQVTGQAVKNGGTMREAFLYDSNTANWTDLGHGVGNAINASGQVTGQNYATGFASLYSSGGESDLGALPGGTTSTGYAINAAGQIVGSSAVAGTASTHAFFYDGAMHDMNSLLSSSDPLKPFVTLTDAHGINVNRQIVVNGIDSRTNLQHAYVLRVPPWLDVAPGTLAFASQAIDTVSSAQAVTLSNVGATPLAMYISTTGDFSETNDCGVALAPSAQCAVKVTFGPMSAGNLAGALAVTSAGTPIAIVPLSGTTPVQVTIVSSAATTTAAIPVNLTWKASAGASCTATGGSAADKWTGSLASSGTQSVTESAAGTYKYGLICKAGSQSASGQVSVVVTWPTVSVTISASPTTIIVGQSTTLTWKSSNANMCVASGGGAGDNWSGTKPVNGSASATENVLPATPPVTLTFTLKCTSSLSSLSATAKATVIVNAPPFRGGALDPWSALFLAGAAALRRIGFRRMILER